MIIAVSGIENQYIIINIMVELYNVLNLHISFKNEDRNS